MKHSKLALIWKGMAMGIAEVIPGVSGGTIAFITGIYQDLIDSIKSIGPDLFRSFRDDGIKGAWNTMNGDFLMFLLFGMVGGFVAGTFGITYLLEHYPEPLWGFFFGLIISSAILIGKQIKGWDLKKIVLFIVGIIVAYGITVLSPSEGNTAYWYVFLSGMIAISALLLPGISGSFILLLMGMYTFIIPLIKDTIKNMDLSGLPILIVFGLGCIVGLVTFSRVLSWLFHHHEGSTLALLTGFLIGALNKVWPWRNLQTYLNKESGVINHVVDRDISGIDFEVVKIMTEQNVMPADYFMDTPKTLITLICMLIGFGLIFLLGDSEKGA